MLQEIARCCKVGAATDFELRVLLLDVKIGKVIVGHETDDLADVRDVEIGGSSSRIRPGLRIGG